MTNHDAGHESEASQRAPRFANAATLGAFLRHHREERNISLQHVVNDTKISERYLAALERGDIEQWPTGFYRRAMIRAYATAVGLNPTEVTREFDQLADEHVTTPSEPPAIERNEGSIEGPGVGAKVSAAVAVAAATAFALYGLSLINGMTRSLPSVAPVAGSEVEGTAGAGSISSSAPAVSLVTSTEPAQEAPPPETILERASEEGALSVTSNPAGAQVTVNGIRWGLTPLTIRNLSPGRKRIRLTMDGHVGAERSVQLTRDRSSQTVNVDLEVQR